MTLTGNSQVEELESKLPAVSDDPAKPRMPFGSALQITREQEDALVHHALQRIEQIENQLGKTSGSASSGFSGRNDFPITADPESFFGKRQKYTARYYNHVEDRVKADTVYEHSNVTASLSQRITAQMIAKSCRFFFGRPDDNEWFTTEAVGPEDTVLAEKIKKYARFIAAQCEVKPRHVQAVEFGWVRGESVIKTVNREQFQIFKRTATILVESDAKDSEPILDAHGDYILSTDATVDEMEQVPISQVPPEMVHLAIAGEPVEGEEQMALLPTGKKLLKRDGVTEIPAKPVYRTEKITKKNVTFEGPDSRICYYMDFLAPLDASGIQPGEADLIAHLYDKSVMSVAQMFGGQYAEGDEGVKNFQSAVDILRTMLSDTPGAKSAEGQPREDFKEQDTDASPNNPRVQIAECWLTYDADGDGIEEEIMLVLDRRNRVPIFYEYTANVTLRGLRPFEVVCPIAVDGRWYGMGGMEYFDPEQTFIDLQLNRRNFLDGGSGRVTLWRPYNTLEGQRDPNLKMKHGGTYTPKEGKTDADVLSYVMLPNDGDSLEYLLNKFEQYMMLKSGTVNGADQEASNLPTAETATGINEVRESGDELFSMFLLRLHGGLSRALAAVNDVIFSNLNTRKVFAYFNGQATEILELTPDDVRDLPINSRLSITQSEDRQILQSGNVADQVIDGFYMRQPWLQQRTAPYARARLKALKVPQADAIIEPLPEQVVSDPGVTAGAEAPVDPMEAAAV